jgi:hypothetical protein
MHLIIFFLEAKADQPFSEACLCCLQNGGFVTGSEALNKVNHDFSTMIVDALYCGSLVVKVQSTIR